MFAMDCSQLVKMVTEPEEWHAFATYLEEIQWIQESFVTFEFTHVPRTKNIRADSLARGARNQLAHFIFIDLKSYFGLAEF